MLIVSAAGMHLELLSPEGVCLSVLFEIKIPKCIFGWFILRNGHNYVLFTGHYTVLLKSKYTLGAFMGNEKAGSQILLIKCILLIVYQKKSLTL